MGGSKGVAAGASALGVAVQLDLDIGCVQRQLMGLMDTLEQLRDRQCRFRAGAAGEQHVVQVLVDMIDTRWTLLPDRRWPGTRRANIDVLLAGPGGIFVIDVKRWKDVRIETGALWRGDDRADDAIDNLAAQASVVQDVLADEGLAPAEVMPLLVLDRAHVAPTRLGPVHVLGERHLTRFLLQRAARLTADQVGQVTEALERACPPMPTPARASAVTPATVARTGRDPGPGTQQELLDMTEVWRVLADSVAAEPIEVWMTWLHPSQARLVARSWSGPARIRGAAGTGKTVVALHRARHLALTGRTVLYTSHVNTLGPVFQTLFRRLAPDLVDFRSVHHFDLGMTGAGCGCQGDLSSASRAVAIFRYSRCVPVTGTKLCRR